MDKQWLETQFRLNPDKTKASLARLLGLEPPAISKILAEQRQIKAHEYVLMRQFFGMPTEGSRTISQSSYVLGSLVVDLQEKPVAQDQDAWVMPAHLFQSRTKAAPDQIRIFSIQEDSMVPDFKQGEQVLVDLSDVTPSPPGAFVVSDGISHLIRQCEYLPHSDPAQIKLSALNKKYDSYTLPLAEAEIVGRVIAKLEWL